MIKGTVKGELNFPVLKLQKDLKTIATRILIPFMVEAMDNERSITGASYDPISDSVRKQRIINNQGFKPLIATGKLRKSFKAKSRGSNTVVIDLAENRADVGEALQVDGMGGKKWVFFGISPEMEKRAIDHMNLRIRKALKDGESRTTIR